MFASLEMQCLLTETCYVHDPDVILKSKNRTIIIIPTYGYMCFTQLGWKFKKKILIIQAWTRKI